MYIGEFSFTHSCFWAEPLLEPSEEMTERTATDYPADPEGHWATVNGPPGSGA